MKCVSGQQPLAYELRRDGGNCLLILTENVETKSVALEGEEESLTEYSFDRYEITVPYRETLEQDVAKEPVKWLNMAKQKEIEKLSADIRKKRNILLTETDNAFCIDRIFNDLSNVSATSFTEKIKELSESEMATYRQALRDIPKQEGFPYSVDWPTKPQQ